MGGTCSVYWARIGIYSVLVGKSEGKKLPGRPRCKWEDNIKLVFLERGMWDYGLNRAGSG